MIAQRIIHISTTPFFAGGSAADRVMLSIMFYVNRKRYFLKFRKKYLCGS